MVLDPFNMQLDLVCWNLAEDFLYLCLSVILACNFLFSDTLSGFDIRVIVAS